MIDYAKLQSTTYLIVLYARFSDGSQKRGTSLERQFDVMTKEVERLGLSHVRERRIKDEGKSAYHGHHRASGNFGEFESEVMAGEHSNTLLMVERLDRLSRQGHEATLDLLRALTRNGVSVMTLDGDFYPAGEPITLVQVITSSVKAETAKEEGAKRAYRTADNWNRLRHKAKGEKKALTKLVPPWIIVLPNRSMIVDRVREALVHRMFALADAGMGARGIANTFNKEGIKPWARFKGREPKIWEHTKITRILANRAVLGEFHPKVDGKPCPDGPWLDHYPVIVAADLFERVRQNANVREAVKGGAKSAEVPNLFSALARCECCGSNLAYQKGRKAGVFYTKGGKTYSYKRPVGSLVCRVAYNGGDCSNRAYVAYLTFEDAVLDMCLHLALDDGSFARKDEVARLNTLIAGRERAVNVATERAQALWRAFAQTASPMAMGVAQEAEAEAEELAKNVKALKRQREAARGRVSGAEHLARVAGIRANLYTKNLKERRQIRVKVAQSIRSVVTDITVNADKVATVVIANGLGIIRIDGKGRVLTPVLHGQPVLHQKEYQLAALDAADQMHATRTDILRRARRRTTENSGRKQLPDSETHESLGM